MHIHTQMRILFRWPIFRLRSHARLGLHVTSAKEDDWELLAENICRPDVSKHRRVTAAPHNSIKYSVRFSGHFPGEPELAGFTEGVVLFIVCLTVL